MKLFSTRTHGILDFLTAGMLLTLPRAMGWSVRVRRFLTNAAIGTVAYSLLTKYELGVVKVLPMKAHLLIDALNGATFAAAPMIFSDEEPGVTRTLMAIGAWELGAALMTETEPSFSERLTQIGGSMGGTVHEVTERLRERAIGS